MVKLRAPVFLAILGGTLLGLALFWVARPAQVLQLLRGTQPAFLPWVIAASLALLALRAARLALIAGPHLPLFQALPLTATLTSAASWLPFRLGELLLPPLARALWRTNLKRGVYWLLATRVLDVLTLLCCVPWFFPWGEPWKAAATGPAAFGLFLGGWFLGEHALACRLKRSKRQSRGWRLALFVHREFRRLARHPRRLFPAVALSAAIWAMVWLYTATLLRAMGRWWSPLQVAAGVAGAALGTAVPLAGVGNVGPKDAAWAAALAATGVPFGQALASAFALDAWTLLLNTLWGLAGLAFLTRPGRAAS